MLKEMICAGFGGQGVLTAGKIMLYVANKSGLQVTWFPSYGNEMRGGAANCNVVISSDRIASPYADHPDVLIALNQLSVDKFMGQMKSGAILFANTSLIDEAYAYRDDITVYKAPVTDVAISLGNERAANLCMLGYMVKNTDLFVKEDFIKYMCEYFENSGKGKYNAKNVEAFEAGYAL